MLVIKKKINRKGLVNLSSDQKLLLPWLIAILFIVFNGAMRKWGVDSTIVGNLFFGIQIFLALFLLFEQRHYAAHFKYTAVFYSYIWFLLFLSVHPLNLTFGHGFLGFLLYTFVWFILYAYLKVRNRLTVEKLDIIIIAILSIELILSYLQYYSPADHILNIYASGEDANVATIGTAVRTTGTFSYIGGLQGLVVFWGFFSWYALLRYKNIWLVIFIITGGAVCSLFTGSRSAVFQYLLLLFAGMISSGFLSKYFFKMIIVVAVIGLIYLIYPNFLVFDVINDSSENFEERYDSGVESGEMNRRIESQYLGAFYYHGDHPIFGVGLGSTYQGAVALLGKSEYIAEYGYFEDEGERVVIEGGYVLYFFRLIIFIIFLSVLYMPTWSKVLIFILFSNAVLTFNIYLAFFFAFGLIWVDRAYFLRSPGKYSRVRSHQSMS